MWDIGYDKKGKQTLLKQDNPKFYLNDRFFTNDKYRNFSKLPVDEVVSVDSLLFPDSDKTLLDEKSAKLQNIEYGKQILYVLLIENPKTVLFADNIDNFIFCGYDLADEYEISALTNCGGFDETFTYQNLNSFGLISDFAIAQKIKIELSDNNPDEEHANCLIFAIWRRI